MYLAFGFLEASPWRDQTYLLCHPSLSVLRQARSLATDPVARDVSDLLTLLPLFLEHCDYGLYHRTKSNEMLEMDPKVLWTQASTLPPELHPLFLFVQATNGSTQCSSSLTSRQKSTTSSCGPFSFWASYLRCSHKRNMISIPRSAQSHHNTNPHWGSCGFSWHPWEQRKNRDWSDYRPQREGSDGMCF